MKVKLVKENDQRNHQKESTYNKWQYQGNRFWLSTCIYCGLNQVLLHKTSRLLNAYLSHLMFSWEGKSYEIIPIERAVCTFHVETDPKR